MADFEFPIDVNDTIFVLTYNNSNYKEGINNLISKIIVINQLKYVKLDEFSKVLGAFGIGKLNIVSIDNEYKSNVINTITSYDNSKFIYTAVNLNWFMEFINTDDNFLEYNKNTLYILRNGNVLDIKNIFAFINGNKFNIGRGGSQKSHILSPLDLRLSSYMMAMFNGDYKMLSSLNTFNNLSKDRYLSYTNNYFKPSKHITISNEWFNSFKPINISKMPLYPTDLGRYYLECSDINHYNNEYNQNNL